jgi:hypothetical protein
VNLSVFIELFSVGLYIPSNIIIFSTISTQIITYLSQFTIIFLKNDKLLLISDIVGPSPESTSIVAVLYNST